MSIFEMLAINTALSAMRYAAAAVFASDALRFFTSEVYAAMTTTALSDVLRDAIFSASIAVRSSRFCRSVIFGITESVAGYLSVRPSVFASAGKTDSRATEEFICESVRIAKS